MPSSASASGRRSCLSTNGWKILVGEAEKRLATAEGRHTSGAKDLLRPAWELLDDAPFWQNVNEGLAVFLSPEQSHQYRLPVPFEEQVIVGNRFHIKPLLP